MVGEKLANEKSIEKYHGYIDRGLDCSCDLDVDVDDMLTLGIADLAFKAASLFGAKSVSVDIGNGRDVVVEAPDEDPSVDMMSRIASIVGGAKLLSKQGCVDYNMAVALLLVVDGWYWDSEIFRTPIWMDNYAEIPIDDAKEIGGLECLGGSSLEIKSKRSMVWGA